MSFPPGTEMFQFPGFASGPYGFGTGYPRRGGFPHSDIRGSTIARISPRLFAACHVLHRLLAPRHPPNALLSLNFFHRPHAGPTRPRTFAPDQTSTRASNRTAATPRTTLLNPRSLPIQPAHPKACQRISSHQGYSTHHSDSPVKDHEKLTTEVSPGSSLFPEDDAAPAGARNLAQPPGHNLWPAVCGLETVGIEPTTPCLQSRRSPTELRPHKPSTQNRQTLLVAPTRTLGGPGRT